MTPSFNLDPALLAIFVCPARHASLEPTADELSAPAAAWPTPSATTSRCSSSTKPASPLT